MVVFEVYYEHSFFYCFHFMSFPKDMFREFGLALCVSEIFPVFFKSYIEVKYVFHGAVFNLCTSNFILPGVSAVAGILNGY